MSAMPTVFRPFRDDHRRVLARLDDLERVIARGGRRAQLGRRAEATLQELAALLTRQFATHMAAEENVLYPAMRAALPASVASLEPLASEHRELRHMLDRLTSLLAAPAGADRDEQVAVEAQDLVDLLRIHIRKEEAVVFTVAKQVLTPHELGQVADRIAAYRPSPTRTRTRRPGTKGLRP
jgi:hemerythrin-like domain-containing protein